jgi:predicted protein tyrosine phosphatase
MAHALTRTMPQPRSVGTAFNQLSLDDSTRMTAGSADRVDPNVFIGGYLAAADPAFVRRHGITRIVKLFADDPSYAGGMVRHPGVAYLVVPAEDVPGYDIRPGAVAALRFIQEGIRRNEQILVHCHMGISRSATVVLLHLMLHRGYDLPAALGRLRTVRSFVRPNTGFMAHLRATDERLRVLRVGDERRQVSPREIERPYIAPRPVEAYNASLLVRLARGDPGHAGGRGENYDDPADRPAPPLPLPLGSVPRARVPDSVAL